jgi:shikimate dehydrogenase
VTGERYLVGLIGAGIGTSMSPALHEREADRHGLRYLYEIIDLDVLGLASDDVGELLTAARRLGFRGLNITHPCKQEVVKYLDDLAPEASELGAVNTVVFHDGRAVGHNTDRYGFATGLARALPGIATGHVVLLGAGGAGLAVASALAGAGVRHLTVADVDQERGRRLAHAMAGQTGQTGETGRGETGQGETGQGETGQGETGQGRTGQGRTGETGQAGGAERHTMTIDAVTPDAVAARLRHADGLVNATPIGMEGHPGSPIDPSLLRADQWVADVIYRPLDTALISAARERGCRVADGGGMVAYQAAASFRLFTGRIPDEERMYRHFIELTRESRNRPGESHN